MPGYIVLGSYTVKALADMDDMPEIIAKHRANCEKVGIRLVGTWCTMGKYDFVSVYDAPDDQTMAVALLDMGRGGLAKTQTMRAFSEEEFGQIVAKLEG